MKSKKFKITKRKLIFLGIILLAVFGFLFFRSRSKTENKTATVKRGVVNEELILTGSVKADKHAILYFPTSGKISWVGVSEGEKVSKGQGLVSLDKTVLNAAYQQSLNNYRNYQATAENVLDSVKDNGSDETFAQKATRTTAEVNRDNAYDSMKAARYNLNNSTLLAPFNGIISSLYFSNPGVNVSLTDKIVEMVDPTSIYFDVDADQNEVSSIKEGQNVIVILDSMGEKELKGTVLFIALTPKIGETGTVYRVKLKFNDSVLDNAIRVGMSGDAHFILSKRENTLYVPSNFVNTDKDGKYVNLGKMGNKVRVETGIEGEDSVEIINGVKEGDVLYD